MYRTFFRHFACAVIAIACLIGLFPASVSALGELAGQTKSASDAGPLDQQTLREIQALSQHLIEAENRKDFDAVKQTVCNSPSALFVAKTATAAEGNWAGFWGHDVVVQHLHDVIFGGPFHMEPDYSKAKVIALSGDVVETYVPVQITVGYAGQQAVPKPFLILMDWVKTPEGWKMASDIAIPVPPPPSQAG
jgi:ketosteroid isomerase-like protein